MITLIMSAALAMLAPYPAAVQQINAGPVYECGMPPGSTSATGAVRCQVFKSSAAAVAAIVGHTLAPGTGAVLLDYERWAATPTSDQLHVEEAVRAVVEVAHPAGLAVIVSVAGDIVEARPAVNRLPDWRRYLAAGLPAKEAEAGADVVELQSQALQRGLPSFASFLAQASAQIAATGRHPTILGGLSSNPPGTAPTAAQITAAMKAGAPFVTGWWFNIPDPAQGACPRCTAVAPGVMAEGIVGAR